jgi:hypothetical protein
MRKYLDEVDLNQLVATTDSCEEKQTCDCQRTSMDKRSAQIPDTNP